MTASVRIITVLIYCCWGSSVFANALHRVNLMSDGQSDRVTFEFDQRTGYKMSTPSENVVEIAFDNVDFSPEFSLPTVPSDLVIITGVSPQRTEKGKLVVTILLQRQAEPSGITLSATPWTYAMDLSPKSVKHGEFKAPYIPGDRPVPTKYTYLNANQSKSAGGLRMSYLALLMIMLLSYLIGVVSVFVAEHRKHRLNRPVATPAKTAVSLSTLEAVRLGLERDLARLKQIVELEQVQTKEESEQIAQERAKLILKLMQEGCELDLIAKTLEMSPQEVRELLNH